MYLLFRHQGEQESAKLWRRVSEAIENDDQQAATEEKSILEEAQRNAAKERKSIGYEWVPKHFELVRTYYMVFLLLCIILVVIASTNKITVFEQWIQNTVRVHVFPLLLLVFIFSRKFILKPLTKNLLVKLFICCSYLGI